MAKDKKAEIEGYSGIYKEIAEKMGVETAREMYQNFAGLQVTFPKKLYTVEFFSKKLKDEHESGVSVRKLSKMYGYTERRVRQLIEKGEMDPEEEEEE